MKISLALALALPIALAACSKKDDKAAEPAAEEAAKTAEPAAAEPAVPAVDPASEDVEVNVPHKFASSCKDVWKAFGDFSKLDHPAIEKVEATGNEVGATRVLTLAGGGGVLKETLEKLDNEAMMLQYRITDSPLPVDDYVGVITLTAEGDKVCAFNWKANFKNKGAPAADAAKAIEGIFKAGVEAAAKTLGTAE